MIAEMMDRPLFLPALLEYAGRWHARTEVTAALADGTIERRTYGDVAVYARKVTQALVGLGVKQGDRVATFGCNSLTHFALFYAIPGLGAVCHTLNPRLPVDQIVHIVETSAPLVLVYDAAQTILVREVSRRFPQTRCITNHRSLAF